LVFVDCSAPDFDEGVLAGIAIRRADMLACVHARDGARPLAHGHRRSRGRLPRALLSRGMRWMI